MSATDQLGALSTNSYDISGRLISSTDATGRSTTYGYDPVGNVTAITYGDGTSVSFGYDAAGRRTSMSDDRGDTTYAYDAVGNLVAVTGPGGDTIAYGWDATGRRSSLTYPDGTTVAYGYDAAGRLTSVDHPDLGVTAYDYDADGRILTEDLPGADERAYTYDAAGLPATYRQSLDGITTSFTLSHDAAGRLTGLNNDNAWAFDDYTYTYDPAGQLTAANRGAPGGLDDYTWAYDASGNRVTQTQGPFVTTSSYNAANQLTSSRLNTFTPTTYAYDAAGRRTNTTQGANTVSYAYDAAGRLATRDVTTRWWIFSSTWSEHYAYDGEGRLARLDVTSPANVSTGYELGWDTTSGVPQLLSIEEAGGTDSFVYGANRIGVERADGSTGVFSYDPFGSAVRNPDTADVVRADAYSPFGQQQNAPWADPLAHTPAFGYRGELTLDNTIHLRARTYIPGEGLFTTRDPLDGVDGTPTVTSPYHYTANDPSTAWTRPGKGLATRSIARWMRRGILSRTRVSEQRRSPVVTAFFLSFTTVPSTHFVGRASCSSIPTRSPSRPGRACNRNPPPSTWEVLPQKAGPGVGTAPSGLPRLP